jgi:hypothetical protein
MTTSKVNCKVVQVVRALDGVEGLNPAYRYSIFQRQIATVSSLLRKDGRINYSGADYINVIG